MGDQEQYPKEFLPVAARLREAFAKTMDAETARAKKEGMSVGVFFSGMLNTLLNTTIRATCEGMFPQEDPYGKEREERVVRMQRALSEALKLLMRHEAGEAGASNVPSWPGKHGGHA